MSLGKISSFAKGETMTIATAIAPGVQALITAGGQGQRL